MGIVKIQNTNWLFIINLYHFHRGFSKFTILSSEESLLPKRNFEKILIEAIDEGLYSLGESSRQAIYFHLEKNFCIKKREIPRKIKDFAESIEQIFGVGADFLEVLIMKRLCEKVGGMFEIQESTVFAFTEYVTTAKQRFLRKDKTNSILEITPQCEEVRIEG